MNRQDDNVLPPSMVFGYADRGRRWVGYAFAALLVLFLAAVLFPVFAQVKTSRRPICISNLKQLGIALAIYSNDYEDRLPRADRWYDDLAPYRGTRQFRCPGIPRSVEGLAMGYAFNDRLGKVPAPCLTEPGKTLMLYDSSNLLPNASDAGISLVAGGRHDGRNNVSYADTHVRAVKLPESPGITHPSITGECCGTEHPTKPQAVRGTPLK